jgi:hypothetical protein
MWSFDALQGAVLKQSIKHLAYSHPFGIRDPKNEIVSFNEVKNEINILTSFSNLVE